MQRLALNWPLGGERREKETRREKEKGEILKEKRWRMNGAHSCKHILTPSHPSINELRKRRDNDFFCCPQRSLDLPFPKNRDDRSYIKRTVRANKRGEREAITGSHDTDHYFLTHNQARLTGSCRSLLRKQRQLGLFSPFPFLLSLSLLAGEVHE